MDTRYKHTLGRLINDAIKELAIPPGIGEELKDALQLRNWVTHHFFSEYGAIAQSSDLLKKATNRLDKAWPVFEKIAGKIHELVIERLVASGQSPMQIQVGIEKAVEQYINEKTCT